MTAGATTQLGDTRRQAALATLTTVLFLTFLDTTVVSLTLASIQQDLHAGVTTLQWVVNGFSLVFASLMLAGGMLGDLFGRKRVMLLGVVIFCGGSVVGGLAVNSTMLITGRVVMGLGAALSEPGTLSIIRHLYPEEHDRARALGAWAAISGLALAMGPVIGGLLTGLAGWRSVFWFNLAFGAAALVAAAVTIPESSDRAGRRVDVLGIVLSALALGAGVYALIYGEEVGYSDWRIFVLFAVALVAGLGFVAVELRSRSPMLELTFFRRGPYTGAIIVAFVTFFAVLALFFFVALYLQVVVGQSASRTAGEFVPMMVVMILASAFTGRWVAAAGARIPMTVGCVLATAGVFWTAEVVSPTANFGLLAGALALAGLGIGIALVPVTSAALSSVPAERSGMAASTTNTARALGAVFGTAVLGSIVNSQLSGELRQRLKELGVPANFQSIVINGVTHGGLPSQGQGAPAAAQAQAGKGNAGLVQQVIDAAYQAFYSGLHIALVLAGAMLAAAAVLAFFALRQPASAALPEGIPASGQDSSKSAGPGNGGGRSFAKRRARSGSK